MAKFEVSLFSISVFSSLFLGAVIPLSVNRRFVEEAKSKWPLSAPSSTGSCSELNCSFAMEISSSEAAKFRRHKEGADAIFMFVTIGNATIPVREQLKPGTNVQKWAWVRDQRGRFLLTLPYDFDILSLTILTRGAARRVNLNITSTPLSCYANLSESCLLSLISETIVENLTGPLGDVCMRTVDFEGGRYKYKCCEQQNNSMLVCDQVIEDNEWINNAIRLLWASSIAFGLFAPLLFKYLPKGFKRGPKVRSRPAFSRAESEMTDSGASVLDIIAMSSRHVLFALDGGMVDVLREQTESVIVSRLYRCLFVVLLSSLPILQGFIYVYLKGEDEWISTKKLLGVGDAFITLLERDGQYALGVAYLFCIALICIAIAIPRTLPDCAKRLSGRKDERTFLGFIKPEELLSSSDQRGFQLIYENMVFHLNCLFKPKFWEFLFLVITYPLQKLCGLDVFDEDAGAGSMEESSENDDSYKLCSKICTGVLLLLFFPLWAILIITAFLLYIFPVTYVAFRIWKMLFRIEVQSPCCDTIPSSIKMISFPILYIMFIVFCICVEASYFMLVIALTFNIMSLGSVTGFTIMGLLFYIDIYLPYIVFGVWVIVYVARGINKYYDQFTNLKTILFEECEKYDNNTKVEANIRDTFRGPYSADRRTPSTSSLSRSRSDNFLVSYDEHGVPNIPLDIFLESSRQLMPFKRIFLAKALKVIALGGYLVVIFLFVMSLSECNAASTLVQALALLFLGGLPLLALNQGQGDMSQAAEIKARFHVKDVIKQYAKRTF